MSMDLDTQPGLPTSTPPKPAECSRTRRWLHFMSKLGLKLRFGKVRLQNRSNLLDFQILDSIKTHLTFYRLHLAYFILVITIGASILYGTHKSERRFSLVDAIFNTVSIVTVTGLTSVRVADFLASDRALVLVLMTLGSPVFTSLLPLYVRRFYFYRHHRAYVKEFMKDINGARGQHIAKKGECGCEKLAVKSPNVQVDCSSPLSNSSHSGDKNVARLHTTSGVTMENDQHIDHGHQLSKSNRLSIDTNHHDSPQPSLCGTNLSGFQVNQKEFSHVENPGSDFEQLHALNNGDKDRWDESYDFKICRRNRFCSRISGNGHKTERFQLRQWLSRIAPNGKASSPFIKTMEHQGLVTLCWLVPLYMVGTQLASFVLSLVLIYTNKNILNILEEKNLNSAFFSVATTVSAFTSSGVPADDDNMIPFKTKHFVLLLYTMVSLMGNLLYPPCIRLIIWILHAWAGESRKPVYGYLLEHPRRCFTHLFPTKQSVWLCLTVLGFTAVQLVFFCALDWNSEALQSLDPLSKIVDGVYQSVSVRNSGGAVVSISQLAPPMLVLYVFMMFIAVYPVALLRQNSAEYEHADLGIYKRRWNGDFTDNSLKFQSRKLLAKDSVYLCTVLFIICLLERRKIVGDPLNYSIFNIIFEVVSAYGGVGMSMGYSCALRIEKVGGSPTPCTDVPYSFSGKWSSTGQIVLAITMLVGRHRGLPYAIDSAIKLPPFNDVPLPSTRVSTAVPHVVELSLPLSSPRPSASDKMDTGRYEFVVKPERPDIHRNEDTTEIGSPKDEPLGGVSQLSV